MRIGSRITGLVVFLTLACFGRWETIAADSAQQHATPTAVDLCGTPAEIGATWGSVNRQALRRAMERYLARAKTEKLSEKTLLERAQFFVNIVKRIAPHWIEEARAVARAAGLDADLYLSFLANTPRAIGFHECTSYAVSREFTQGHAIFFHKNRDNVDCEQAAYILASSVKGVKFIAVSNASAVNCSMMVNDQGLAGSGDYPAHLTRKGDPGALLPAAAEPRYRGMMNDFLLRHIAEKASDCSQALCIIQDFTKRGYYAGGTVNGTHWLFVDRTGTIMEVSSNARHVVSKIHTQKVYFSRLDGSPAAKRLHEAGHPIDFHLFHNVSRDPSICLKSSISGMTVEIDPTHPEALTCAWVSLPAHAVSFPLLMGQTQTPACLLSGEAYSLGRQTSGKRPLWEDVEQTVHASKERLKEKILASTSVDEAKQAAKPLDSWAQQQAATLLQLLYSELRGKQAGR